MPLPHFSTRELYRPAPVNRHFVEYLMHGEITDGPVLLEEILGRPYWMAFAVCRDHPTELFFPTRGTSTAPAKEICAKCSVRSECLEYVLESVEAHNDSGVWGGTSVRERRQLRKERPRPARALVCVIEGCGRPVIANDRCIACYRYLERHGKDRPVEMVLAQNEREAVTAAAV
jgi:WhiB family redox-sensing transcriptional regulator